MEEPQEKSVASLPPRVLARVLEMLTHGMNFESVALALIDNFGISMPIHAIEDYFRSTPDLQKARAEAMIATKDWLKQLVRDGEDMHSGLADSVLLLGLMQLSMKTQTQDFSNAMRVVGHKSTVEFRSHDMQIKDRKVDLAADVAETRKKHSDAQTALLHAQLDRLRTMVVSAKDSQELGQETIDRIHQIYGLASEN